MPGQISAIFRVYSEESALTENTHPADALRPDTVQTIAMLELMLKKWNEPPNFSRLHLSTLIHQILSLVRQKGGITALEAWEYLIESGVFRNIDKPLFSQILKRMGHAEVRLLEQAPDSTLLFGSEGEKITDKYDFYAVFETPEEFRVVFKNKEIGKLPMALPYKSGDLLIFGGRYWKVREVDVERHEIVVDQSSGGVPPKFGGSYGPQSDTVVAEMRKVYMDMAVPRYLDRDAIILLQDARKSYAAYDLHTRQIIPWQNGFLLFSWLGSAGQTALMLALMTCNLKVNMQSICISVDHCSKDELITALNKIKNQPNLNGVTLAHSLVDKKVDKFDLYLDDPLQAKNVASAKIDTSRLQDFIEIGIKELS